MKLDVGDIIEIKNRQAIICYTKDYDNEHYICVVFDDGQVEYDIYKYKFEEEKLLVCKIEDSEELGIILGELAVDNVREYGLSDNLKPIIEYFDRHEIKDQS